MREFESDYTEDTLVEQPAIELFETLDWEAQNCFFEIMGVDGTLGRETRSDVVLVRRLLPALAKLNPGLPNEALMLAIEELTKDRSLMIPVQANREIYDLIKNGVKVSFLNEKEEEQVETVTVIDWKDPANNDFFLASQLWVTGEVYTRRADLVGFVNGLPLVFVELKAAHKNLEVAYKKNLSDYRNTIPQIFWYNAFVILSNGVDSKIGSTTASWEHFTEWKRINSEGEVGVVSLETIIRGTCDPQKLLDIVENFTVFSEAQGGLVKIVAKNHQYLGVNNAIEAVKKIEDNKGRLGVFWHTQGSGKSYSMLFFSQKILRKVPGNWTFLVVTDRKELDEQIYKTFTKAGVVTEPEESVHAESGEHLKELLTEDHRYVFSLIQKFRTEKGQKYPKLSDRQDIIVITDEAHRTQYDILALNMRNALPESAFIGFTGTPLMVGEEKTREVFGDYVSIYNFKQSIDDNATVPLYYENRIPELELVNVHLNEDMEELLEKADLTAEEERRFEREFAREYHLITRDDRLEAIAEDIVEHFMGRGYKGKAMVVSIDKATAIRMYDKVKKYWTSYLGGLKAERAVAIGPRTDELGEAISYMEETDMAVVVSQAQNEVEELAEKGLDILPHRRRMIQEDLETKFKDPDDPFRIVFVCAMWMTGFDVPSCSTIYLDKPMKNHTLMQTIARANRVFGEKVNGLIVDYVGVFRDLQRALAIYGSDAGGGIKEGERPVEDKSALIEYLRHAIDETVYFCAEQGVDLEVIPKAAGFERVGLLRDARNALVKTDDIKRRYLAHASEVSRLYKAILPDPLANELSPMRAAIVVLAEMIYSIMPKPDISGVMGQVEQLLDESVAAEEGYRIEPTDEDKLVDLSQIDFEALRKRFIKGRKYTEIEKLKGSINSKLKKMVRLNKQRVDYMEKFQKMIDEWNQGAQDADLFLTKLIEFTDSLNEEDRRGIKEGLTEEELALFDILTKPAVELTKSDIDRVKEVAKGLLDALKREKLVLDWRKRQQSRAAVHLAIEEILDRLPEAYTKTLYEQKVKAVYQHVYDSYFGQGKSIYTTAS